MMCLMDGFVKVYHNVVFNMMVCQSVRQHKQNAWASVAVFASAGMKESLKAPLNGFSLRLHSKCIVIN